MRCYKQKSALQPTLLLVVHSKFEEPSLGKPKSVSLYLAQCVPNLPVANTKKYAGLEYNSLQKHRMQRSA